MGAVGKDFVGVGYSPAAHFVSIAKGKIEVTEEVNNLLIEAPPSTIPQLKPCLGIIWSTTALTALLINESFSLHTFPSNISVVSSYLFLSQTQFFFVY